MERAHTFKGMEVTTWFKPMRGGAKARERKDLTWTMSRLVGESGGQRPYRVKESGVVVEAVCFIPFMPGSKLRKELQEKDDALSTTLQAPKIRFVERGGLSTVD